MKTSQIGIDSGVMEIAKSNSNIHHADINLKFRPMRERVTERHKIMRKYY